MEDKEISITLTAAQWNAVLAVLAQGPFNQVADIIAGIKTQGEAALRAGMSQEEPVQE